MKIKFRGKRVSDGKWIYGYYGRCEDAHFIYICDIVCIDHDTGYEENVLIPYEVDSKTVGQYRFRNDSIEIYDGDIMKITGEEYFSNYNITLDYDEGPWEYIGKVYYDPDGYLSLGKELALYEIIGEECEMELIGNVHDNPKLLEGK